MLHLRFLEAVNQPSGADQAAHVGGHAHVTIFMNGANCGNLTLRPAEAIWLNHILQKGCEALKFKFIASGPGPDAPASEIDACAVALSSVVGWRVTA